ncbi:fas apoptotic inhibitory molecule 1 isoform X1 [Pelmatolapia mariae]|uniref:fas apoptotic inhibitory molecule 1 isoform X1 n=1 Tax=Pelmatolapia mariae TaxID=158779 RepID=UPI002FE56592
MLGGDVVAVWEVALSDGVYRIEFAHGTTTGKRIVFVNGKEVIRKDWMFKLVGKETFMVGGANTKATINIEAVSGFAYEYSLNIAGKSLQKFIDNRAKTTKTWLLKVGGEDYRVVLEKDTMDVWCNGQKMETTVSATGRVCRRRHRDALHGRRARVLHQGSERRAEEERHCALFTAGWRESDSVHAIELLFQTLFEVLECSGTGWRPSPDKQKQICFWRCEE